MSRRETRQRKVSQKVGALSDADKQQAASARLQALELDEPIGALQEDISDDEFLAEGTDEEDEDMGKKKGKRRRNSGPKRKTRGAAAERRNPVARTFEALLDEADLGAVPPNIPTYARAAVGPSKYGAPRKFCSVCGLASPYKCVRCSSRFCSKKCYGVHVETRCLKFIA